MERKYRMRKVLIAGNWKMHLDRDSAVALARSLSREAPDTEDRDVLVCPSFPLLADVKRALGKGHVLLGAQNMHFEDSGAFTGEVSADMLLSIGCSHVILGHSERRHIFHEDNETVNKKVMQALSRGLIPILCVGELLAEREAGKTEDIVKDQVVGGLRGVSEEDMRVLVIAYEPVWAIGTGKTATPEDADGVHGFIRETVADLYNAQTAEGLCILYGGSVKPQNVDGLMAMDNIDGALVGGASLKADSFLRIIDFQC